ncbi:MAG TPA: zeta toxin family protein [Blastocatellia bacterium]|nr:zeta toxin family protein [Blastocatellia bacterium]
MTKPSPQIIILAGPNGAGKSTLAPFLLRDHFGSLEFVNADTIASGLSAFQPERAAIEAGRVMLKRLRELAARRENFAFETTLATKSYVPWLSQLVQDGYLINLMFVWLSSPELAVERVKERVASGGHDIPKEIIRRRYKKGIRNFFTLYQLIAETWGVYDNSEAGEPVLIAKGKLKTQQIILQADRWTQFIEAAK